MGEHPGDPSCICQGTGLTTRLAGTGNTGPEICGCVIDQAKREERERVREALLSDKALGAAMKGWADTPRPDDEFDTPLMVDGMTAALRAALDSLEAPDG